MNVRDAMAADVRVVTTDDSVAAAARAMRDAGTGFLPVLEGGSPVGVVTDRDLVVRFLAEGGNDPGAPRWRGDEPRPHDDRARRGPGRGG